MIISTDNRARPRSRLAWVFHHLNLHYDQSGSFRRLIIHRMGFDQSAYVDLCARGMNLSHLLNCDRETAGKGAGAPREENGRDFGGQPRRRCPVGRKRRRASLQGQGFCFWGCLFRSGGLGCCGERRRRARPVSKLPASMQLLWMTDQSEFDFTAPCSSGGLSEWRAEREREIAALCLRMGMPINRRAEVTLTQGPVLRGTVRLAAETLWVESRRHEVRLCVEGTTFTICQVASAIQIEA